MVERCPYPVLSLLVAAVAGVAPRVPLRAAEVQDVVGIHQVGAPLDAAALGSALQMLRSDDPAVQTRGLLQLSKAETPSELTREVVPVVASVLRRSLAAPRPYPRESLAAQNMALLYLQQLGSDSLPALPDIIAAAGSADPIIRWWAITTLNYMRLRQDDALKALPAVIAALELELAPARMRERAADFEFGRTAGDGPLTERKARRAFALLPQEAWPSGIGIGFGPDSDFDALQFIRELGPAAKPTVPLLVRCLEAETRLNGDLYRTLTALGESASEAVPALVKILEQIPNIVEDSWDSDRVLLALARVGRTDARARAAIVRRFEGVAAKLGEPAVPARANYMLFGAVVQLAPAEDEVVRVVIRAVARASPIAFTPQMTGNGPVSLGNMTAKSFPEMADRFFRGITAQNSGTLPDFIALARNGTPPAQRLAFIALRQLGGIPAEFVPVFVRRIEQPTAGRQNDYQLLSDRRDAFDGLGSMGSRAAAAVPALRSVLRSGLQDEKLQAAHPLAQIGGPAALAAKPDLETFAQDLLAARMPIPLGFCDDLLALDPGSAVARRLLAEALTREGSGDGSLEVRRRLMKLGIDAPVHRAALSARFANSTDSGAFRAAAILAADATSPATRTVVIDRLFALLAAPEAEPRDAKNNAARGLEALLPADKAYEGRLRDLIRGLRTTLSGFKASWPDWAFRDQYRLQTLIRILARYEVKSPETEALLAELRKDYNEEIRAAANGRSAYEF